MRLKSKTLSILLKAAILILLVRCLMISSGLIGAGLRIRFFILFPSVCCVLALLYYLGALGWNIWNFWERDKVTFFPFMKYLVLISMALTFLLVKFVLGDVGELSLQNTAFLLYYVVPALVFIDYLLLDEKGTVKGWMPTGGSVFPLAYQIFIWFMVEFRHHSLWAGQNEGAYPYVFFDIRIVGIGGIVMFAIAVILIYVAAGIAMYWIDQILALPTKKRFVEEDWEDEEEEEEEKKRK